MHLESPPMGGAVAVTSPAATSPSDDIEKTACESESCVDRAPSIAPLPATIHPPGSLSTLALYWKAFERALVRYNIESRGIARVCPSERHPLATRGFLQMWSFWMSLNLTVVITVLGTLGPIALSLPFFDSCLLAVFGSFLGTLPVGYIATFGPRSGNRTMILTRFITGWYLSKAIVCLTLVIFMGYNVIDSVIGGQILSAVAGGQLTITVGIVIVSLVTWFVSTIGYAGFHFYERYAWLPQLMVLCIMLGVAGDKFNVHGNPAQGLEPSVVVGNRLSFLGLCFAAQLTYAPAASDFFVYYPVNASRTKIFLVTVSGLTLSSVLALTVGIGLGSGTQTDEAWAAAYAVSPGALIVEANKPLGGFGDLCSVIVALSLIANMVPANYACGIDCQALGHLWEKVPRIVWNTLAVMVPMVLAIVGREHLADVFTNFLALMGYWTSVWLAMIMEEHLLFRRLMRRCWNWKVWDDRGKLPLGIAATVAFLVGWAGAVLCMAQVWYVGPLAKLISDRGGDIGYYVGFAWAGLVYPPLRWWEVRRYGR